MPVKKMTEIENGVAALHDQDAEALNNLLREAKLKNNMAPELVQEAKRLLSKMKHIPYIKEDQHKKRKIFDKRMLKEREEEIRTETDFYNDFG